jgi:hypothetical protein
MKKIAILITTLCLMQSAHAQTITSTVPGFISYQGRALNSSGTLMGSGTPVNHTVTFRIWDHESNSLAANLIYSEQQVVTIAEGEFSVLVGAGGATAGTPLGYSETSKGTPTVKINDLGVFAGANRFLGVTIDDGTDALDNEVSPRQQIVSSAYALRARYAEQLGSNGGTALTALDSGNVGIGNTNPPSRFTITAAGTGTSTPQLLLTADDTTERLRIGVDSTGTGTGFIQSFKEGTGAQNLLLNAIGGNVGIGTTAPSAKLDVVGAIVSSPNYNPVPPLNVGQVALAASGVSPMSGKTIFGTDGSNWKYSIASKNGAAAEVDRLVVDTFGNVGIGTNFPGNRLTIQRTIGSNDITAQQHNMQLQIQNGIGAKSMGIGVMDDGKGVLQVKEINNGAGYADLLLNPVAGNVGIGTSSAFHSLTVGPNPGDTQKFSIRAYSNNGQSWQGGGAFGGSSATVVMGELVKVAVIGGHSPILNAWQNLCINPTGGNVGIGTLSPTSLLQVAGTVTYAAAVTSSDLRIKKVQGISDGRDDLDSLMKIKVTDYRLIDTKLTSNKPQKKVIAQQVETVYPQAVNQTTDVVPDIYQKATAKDGWVVLATDLKKGDRVKLIGDNEQGVNEVLEVTAGKFRTDFKAEGDVFVYGREVKDFRTVDYEAIAMLNVSATQQLARELKTVQEENAALRRELTTKDETMEARLIALEQRLSKGSTPETVSIKTPNAAK